MRFAVVLSIVSAVAACGTDPDPEQPDAPVSVGDAPIDSVDAPTDAPIDGVPFGGPDVSGTFLMAMRFDIPQDDPGLWLQLIATWQLDRNAWELRGEYMPLCTSSCETPRAAVPPAIPAGDSLLAEWGGHDVIFNGIIPATANPITGTAQPLSALMHVRFMGPDLVCGVVDATFGGVELDGTVAAVRVASIDPASLPAAISACPE